MARANSPTAYVGITDWDWFQTLRSIPGLDEANFWQPSPGGGFSVLEPGEPFLFKLHAQRGGKIVGCGFFLRHDTVPLSVAWGAYRLANGVGSEVEMHQRVQLYRRVGHGGPSDYEIGCILLKDPVFFDEADWLDAPGWKPNIVRGKGYSLAEEPGVSLWRELEPRLLKYAGEAPEQHVVNEPAAKYGSPVFIRPRLGQRSFKVAVADAYQRRCAVTGERVLPVLEAGHIRPYAEGGEHRIDNGLLMRRDIHRLFDRGYLTVTPELEVQVSERLHEEFNNGHDYLAMSGRQIQLPANPADRPDPKVLAWHNHERYVA